MQSQLQNAIAALSWRTWRTRVNARAWVRLTSRSREKISRVRAHAQSARLYIPSKLKCLKFGRNIKVKCRHSENPFFFLKKGFSRTLSRKTFIYQTPAPSLTRGSVFMLYNTRLRNKKSGAVFLRPRGDEQKEHSYSFCFRGSRSVRWLRSRRLCTLCSSVHLFGICLSSLLLILQLVLCGDWPQGKGHNIVSRITEVLASSYYYRLFQNWE